MVEFYDIEEPEPPSAPELPLTPPPEFEDLKMKTYSYYDPDTQQHVEYQIPEIPSSPPPSVPFHRTSAFALVTGRSASSRAGSNLLPGDARNSSRGASSFAPLGGRNSPRTGRTSPSGPRTDCESYEDEFPSLRWWLWLLIDKKSSEDQSILLTRVNLGLEPTNYYYYYLAGKLFTICCTTPPKRRRIFVIFCTVYFHCSLSFETKCFLLPWTVFIL